MRIDDNAEALAMMRRALGSLEGKIREAYNKGYQDGVKSMVAEDEPQTSCKTCRYGEVDEGYVKCAYYSKSTEQTEPQTEVSAQDYERWLFKETQIDRDDLGDCNICKYVGLEHRCNQCVNGSHFCKVGDEPKTDVKTMSCYGCKHRPMGADICDDPCHCHYEPQTDCAWK